MNVVINLKTKINSSPLLQRVVRAVVFGVGGSVGSRTLMMLSGIVTSRILGKEFYGQFSMINSTVTLFMTFSAMGISATLTRYVALYRNHPGKTGNIIGTLSTFVGFLSTIMSIVLLLISEQISFWVSESNALTGYFRITSITVLISTLASIQQSILLGMERYKKSASIELTRCGIYVIFAGLLSHWKGVYGAIWALLISFSLQFLLMYIENRKEYISNDIVLRFNFDSEIRKIIWCFTIPSFAASLFVLPVNWINNAILARQVGFGELAIFSVALQWMMMITYIPLQMGQVKPIYTDLFAQRKYIELIKILKNITLGSTFLVIPVILFGIIFGKHILALYGDGYEAGYISFVIMMISALLITLQSQIAALLQAIGKMWIGFTLNLIWSVIIVGVFYYFRASGSIGYAIAYATAYGVHVFLSYGMVYYMWKRRRRI